MSFRFLPLLGDLCTRLRHRYALGLGAWCYGRALARMEGERYETLAAEARSTPPPAPVFEQLLVGRLR